MKPSLRRTGIFVGCYTGCAVTVSVLITQSVNLFASANAETVALISIVFILAAVIPASWIAKRLELDYRKRASRRLLEKEWERWLSQQRAQKSVCAAKSTSDPKDASSANFNSAGVSRHSIHPFRPIPAT